jgi:hypothetical protein
MDAPAVVLVSKMSAMSDDEETDDPMHADRRNFYKVEQWSRDGQRVLDLVFAGSSLDKARRIFERITKHRPRTRVLQQHPPQAGVGRKET